MVTSFDPSDDYDGGWESALDGGEVMTDVMLGPVHAYDRADHYTPADRWGTRHQVVSEPFADSIERLERTVGIDDDPSATRVVRRIPPKPARPVSPASRKKSKKKKKKKPEVDAKRDAAVAAALEWDLSTYNHFRPKLQAAETKHAGISERQARRKAVAATLGVTVEVIADVHGAEELVRRRAAAAVEANKKPKKTELRRVPATRDALIAEMTHLAHRLTTSSYPARFFETGALLGMTRSEVQRAVDNHTPRHRPTPPAPKARPAVSTTRSGSPSPRPRKASRQARLLTVAARLGVAPEDITRVRAARVRLANELAGLPPRTRLTKLAAEVQWPFEWVADLEKFEKEAAPKAAPPKARRSPSASQVSWTKSSNFCPACDCRVDATGRCRCS